MFYLAEAIGPTQTTLRLHTEDQVAAMNIKPGLTLHWQNEFIRVIKVIERQKVIDRNSKSFYDLHVEVERGMRNAVAAGTCFITTSQMLNMAHPDIQVSRADEMVEDACMLTLEFICEKLLESPEYIKILKSDKEFGITAPRRSSFWNGVKKKLRSELAKIQ